jgi:hypothetical protein
MRRIVPFLVALTLFRCSSEESGNGAAPDSGTGARGGAAGGTPDASVGGGAGAAGSMNPGTGGGGRAVGGAPQGYPDSFSPDGAPPKIGVPGCGFATAAFCDTFEGASNRRGRAGDLDALFWSASRHQGQLSTTRAIGIGMAVIPECRPGWPTHVWPDGDTLICEPTADVASRHLLVGAAAQNYGQNGYRIRQPFDFAGPTGKIVFDAAVNMLNGLYGWVSLAITEDPIAVPGYAIRGNDEGSIIPKNAVEVHFINVGDMTRIGVRNVHIFRNYADTVYEPVQALAPSFKAGKLNHYEFTISEQGMEVTLTPYSEDGVSFAPAQYRFKVDANMPLSRGYVHVSVHNHAMIKYTQPDTHPAVVDATVAQIDNVGFDGPVIGNWREYEVPDALVEFNEPLGDPYNPENKGYDIGYVVGDEADGSKQVLHLAGVDTSNAVNARLAFTVWMDASRGTYSDFAFRARFNGKGWLERKFSAEETAFFVDGPTVVDPIGAPVGDPASQGRLGLTLDVPLEDLVSGDNTVEFVTASIPTGYPPLVANVDLVMATR